MNPKANIPKHIRVWREESRFEIEWADGFTGCISLCDLRRKCPCALCDALRDKDSSMEGLHMITPDELPSTELSDVVPVGTYAVQIRWADGHDTGIYPYPYLRDLMQDVSVE